MEAFRFGMGEFLLTEFKAVPDAAECEHDNVANWLSLYQSAASRTTFITVKQLCSQRSPFPALVVKALEHMLACVLLVEVA